MEELPANRVPSPGRTSQSSSGPDSAAAQSVAAVLDTRPQLSPPTPRSPLRQVESFSSFGAQRMQAARAAVSTAAIDVVGKTDARASSLLRSASQPITRPPSARRISVDQGDATRRSPPTAVRSSNSSLESSADGGAREVKPRPVTGASSMWLLTEFDRLAARFAVMDAAVAPAAEPAAERASTTPPPPPPDVKARGPMSPPSARLWGSASPARTRSPAVPVSMPVASVYRTVNPDSDVPAARIDRPVVRPPPAVPAVPVVPAAPAAAPVSAAPVAGPASAPAATSAASAVAAVASGPPRPVLTVSASQSLLSETDTDDMSLDTTAESLAVPEGDTRRRSFQLAIAAGVDDRLFPAPAALPTTPPRAHFGTPERRLSVTAAPLPAPAATATFPAAATFAAAPPVGIAAAIEASMGPLSLYPGVLGDEGAGVRTSRAPPQFPAAPAYPGPP
ncbi:MAG: hypothetical protein JSS07_12800, partial [Proteobacteria bacterium]|nr:hypothetical protein [Pseudomonadota bacterium]